ncbi:PAS domain S-box protein [Natrialba swarupiae]|nr:PAS domain S-box protein [Natrialba swarupiae]
MTSLPSVWFPEDDELSLVANSDDHQRLLEETGTPDPSHPRGSWVWDVFEDGDTVVRSPMSREELAADVPLQSSIVLPIGSHGIFACCNRCRRLYRPPGESRRNSRSKRPSRTRPARAAECSRTAKEFVDDLLDAIEDVVYVLDTAGDLQMWNAAFEEVTGYESDEVASMNATEFFAGDDVEAAAAAVEGPSRADGLASNWTFEPETARRSPTSSSPMCSKLRSR